jgi:8-oxo-dGTP pyrophosphatase MutT (NUDIX family)
MTNQSANPWKKLASKVVYRNKWYSVRRDKIIRPDGKPGEYNVVEAPDGVFIAALDDDKNAHLIRKYRYATGIYSLEIPAGGIERYEEPLEAARRELQEELGLVAQDWRSLGKFQCENAYVNNFGHVFVASDLSEAGQHDRLAEGINKTEKMPIKEVLHMIKTGEITDSQSISALTIVALDLGLLG